MVTISIDVPVARTSIRASIFLSKSFCIFNIFISLCYQRAFLFVIHKPQRAFVFLIDKPLQSKSILFLIHKPQRVFLFLFQSPTPLCIFPLTSLLCSCKAGPTCGSNSKTPKHLNIFVESNGCLAVKPKNVKLSYAEMVKVTTAVEMQDRIIGNGGDPTTDLIQVDIKRNNPIID